MKGSDAFEDVKRPPLMKFLIQEDRRSCFFSWMNPIARSISGRTATSSARPTSTRSATSCTSSTRSSSASPSTWRCRSPSSGTAPSGAPSSTTTAARPTGTSWSGISEPNGSMNYHQLRLAYWYCWDSLWTRETCLWNWDDNTSTVQGGSCGHGRQFGAGVGCRSPNLWPGFVLCQHMSNLCLTVVLILSLPSICLVFILKTQHLSWKNPSFVILANIYPAFVPNLFQFLTKILQKLQDKSWTIFGLTHFYKTPGHPVPGHRLDILWTYRNPKVVHLLT